MPVDVRGIKVAIVKKGVAAVYVRLNAFAALPRAQEGYEEPAETKSAATIHCCQMGFFMALVH